MRTAPVGDYSAPATRSSPHFDLRTLCRAPAMAPRKEGRGALAAATLFVEQRARPKLSAKGVRHLIDGRHTGRRIDRPTRFVIETEHPIPVRELTERLRIALDPGPGAAAGVVGNSFTTEPLFPGADPQDRTYRLACFYFLILPYSEAVLRRASKGTNATFYDLAYEIRDAGGFVNVDPDTAHSCYVRPLQEKIPGCTAGRKAAPSDRNWSVGAINFPANLVAEHRNGAGIRIGHLDTGHTTHPELDLSPAFDLNADHNEIDRNNPEDATDPMPDGGSHGTATACLLTSSWGTTQVPDENGALGPGVNGIARGATIVDVRCIDSVVVIANGDIARAAWHAIQEDVHVITMSLGGYAIPWLQAVIAHAVLEKDIIVCAAAGNCWPFVVFPAGYSECIAVAGCNASDRNWTGSASGSKVDIAAPAENVWVTGFNDRGEPIVRPGEGTSFATPHVAGAAALWLAFHRNSLAGVYDGTGVPRQEAFREVIKLSARVPDGWQSRFGKGILDATAALHEFLPPPDVIPRDYSWEWHRLSNAEVLFSIFEGSEHAKAAVEQMLADSRMSFEEFMNTCGAEFNRALMESPAAWQKVSDAANVLAQPAAPSAATAADAVGNAVQDAVDAVATQCSQTANAVAGWLGL